ncbi:MAG: TonB-dependent receptor [Bacteroidales bacterium]|jgi:iron complex outermembrane receptor protein
MKKINYTLALLTAFFMFFAVQLTAQNVKGIVKDAETKENLYGATAMIKGTSTGNITDENGYFSFKTTAGTQTVVISYVGYETVEREIDVKSGETADIGVIYLEASAMQLSGVEIIADRAKERETPVAFTNIEAREIEQVLGSRDLPLALNSTPSVYSTDQGGGAGDARINVRGFNQRNVAIMINGVPVNDMENGWVYWSNWDGISDATSSIQMQRGLSAVNLATPSIGGTMNVITSPTERKPGGTAKFEYGSANFMKATVTAHTGMINDKFALSFSGVRKVGDGVIDGAWTDAWAYYLGAAWNINSRNRIELYAMGAPQRHGQNTYKQNIASYDSTYAKSLEDFDPAAIAAFPQANADSMYAAPFGYNNARGGVYYNENWSPVSSSYTGQQFFNGKVRDRHSRNMLNERENYYHKPLVNLNWYTSWSDKVSQFTTVYYSGGRGGGTGTLGSVRWNYHAGIVSPSRWVHWDKTIEANEENGASKGILRNSVNNQDAFGALSKVKIDWNENLKSQVGIDWRTAKINHFREVRDLLGGTHYVERNNQFNPNYEAKLGDKIAYDFTNDVNWLGGYLQTEYSKDFFSIYATVGYSGTIFKHTNHFMRSKTDSTVAMSVKSDLLTAFQAKGGMNFRLTERLNVYANGGYVQKLPIVDAVINDRTSELIEDPSNEKFISGEVGANYRALNNTLNINLNGYYTMWNDRVLTRSSYYLDNTEGIYVITNLDAIHRGVELDFAFQPIKYFRLDGAVSLGDWFYTNDASGTFKTYDSDSTSTLTFYTKDLKVGDAPQTQLAISATLFPFKGFYLTAGYRYYTDFYADWSADTRIDENDREQSWKTPAYGLLEFHLGYQFRIDDNVSLELFGHMFNALNTIYIQDAVDNSSYNAYRVNKQIVNPHKADAAEVFLGTPRTFNVGMKLHFK